MKRRALPWDPWAKMFTAKSLSTIPRLLDPEEEELAREYEERSHPECREEFLLYMSEAAIFKNW